MCPGVAALGHQTPRDAGEQPREGAGILERVLVRSARIAEVDSHQHHSVCHFDKRVSHRFVAVEMNDHVVAAVIVCPPERGMIICPIAMRIQWVYAPNPFSGT